MKYYIILLLFTASACYLNTDVKDNTSKYFDKKTKQIFLNALDHYKKDEYKKADSLFTIVINNSKDKLTMTMPKNINPFYFRGHLSIDLNKFDRTITDLDHVASDTTNDPDILLLRTEAFRMLKLYDTSIALCNRLLKLHIDSSVILSQRGICFYEKGDTIKACNDLKLSKLLAPEKDTSLNELLKNCK